MLQQVNAFVNASKVTILSYFASPSNAKMDRASAIIHKKRFESILILNLFSNKKKSKCAIVKIIDSFDLLLV